jgi:hypothetical protein
MFDDQSVEPEAAPTAAMASIEPRITNPSKIALSGPVKIDLSVYRGDSGRFRISVKDPSGNPIDLTGATWDADIRLKAADANTICSFDIAMVAGDTSSIDVILSAENSDLLTAACVYDVEMRLGVDVTTLVYGNITVTQDVSRP